MCVHMPRYSATPHRARDPHPFSKYPSLLTPRPRFFLPPPYFPDFPSCAVRTGARD